MLQIFMRLIPAAQSYNLETPRDTHLVGDGKKSQQKLLTISGLAELKLGNVERLMQLLWQLVGFRLGGGFHLLRFGDLGT